MQLYINGRFLCQAVTGVQRFATELVQSLDRLLDDQKSLGEIMDFTLLTPLRPAHRIELKNIAIRPVGKLQGHLWEQSELPLHTGKALLLNLCNTGPLFKSNQIVVIHDAGVFATPHAYSTLFRYWYQLLFKRLGKKAKRIVTVSDFSKTELNRWCGISDSRIRVIYEGAEHLAVSESKLSLPSKLGLEGKRFILAVSSMNPNKNFKGIARAVELISNLDIHVAIAGGFNPKIFQSNGLPRNPRILNLGYIVDSELKALYKNAFCFLYPSFYEGFGLPPLEAMSSGCPVITARSASLPEICGDAALYCDPHRPEDIANKIQFLLEHPSLRDELSDKGRERAKHFTWRRSGEAFLEVVQEVVENKKDQNGRA